MVFNSRQLLELSACCADHKPTTKSDGVPWKPLKKANPQDEASDVMSSTPTGGAHMSITVC